jgi:hypothetical protein
MTVIKQTSKEYFKSIRIIYFALLIGQLLFAGVSFFLNQGIMFQPNDLRDTLIYIVPIVIINAMLLSNFLYKRKITGIKKLEKLTQKMGEYRISLIARLAPLEGASLFSIVAYFLTVDMLFLAMSAVVVAYYLWLQPNVEKLHKT